MRNNIVAVICAGALLLLLGATPRVATGQDAQPAASAALRPVGTIKAIAGGNITLTTDAKTDVTVQVQDSTRIVRTAPGQKDLKDAKPMTAQELQVGDRMLARGTASADGKTVVASSIIVMTKADVAQKQEHDIEDWQRRGIGGVVGNVDAGTGTITLASATAAAKPVTIHATPSTVVRRYAPDSVKFEDASRASLADIKAGDQIRARGTRSADGSEIAADEIVAGTFRHLAGEIKDIDTAKNTITLTDLATKKAVVVQIAPDSQLHKLPLMAAQMMAMRLRGAPSGEGPAAPSGANRPPTPGQAAPSGEARPQGGQGEGRPGGFGAAGGARRGGGDISQMLNRMPAITLAELQKGDAVMIVSTQGNANQVIAITLLSGVEPILTAAPNGNRAAMLLTPWNLGGAGGEGEAQ